MIVKDLALEQQYENNYYCRDRRHFSPITNDFTGIQPSGIDLPKTSKKGFNIEVKSCCQTKRMLLTLHQKDNEADFILFFDFNTKNYYLFHISKFNFFTKGKKGFSTKFIEKSSLYKCNREERVKLSTLKQIVTKLRKGIINLGYNI